MAVDVGVACRLFTRDEYHRMAEVGILKPNDRVELIRGEIVEMSPTGRRQVAFVNNLTQLLVLRLAGHAIVSVQDPVVFADDTEPQPDLAILRHRPIPYKEREAYTEDVLLLIEVAESYDRYDQAEALRRGRHPRILGDRLRRGEHRGLPDVRRGRLSRRESCRRSRDGDARGLPGRRADDRRDLRVAAAGASPSARRARAYSPSRSIS